MRSWLSLLIIHGIFSMMTMYWSHAFGQIDENLLLIGRNNGTHLLDDGNSTRIFGFATTLVDPIAIPGPTLEVNSGDSVRLDFWNMSQGAPHTVHLHGLDVNQQNDGVGMLSFEVEHSQHGYYYFKAPHPGTYLYHCHVGSSIHLQAGMYGMVIVRPSDSNPLLNWEGGESFSREFVLLASEIDTVWHNDTILDHEHDSTMLLYTPETFDPQYFLVNGMSGAQLQAVENYLVAMPNEKLYFRLANIGYYGVRFIFPGIINTRIVASDGRPLPTEEFNDTVEVLPGERYEVFVQLGQAENYPLLVQHFNLNTQQIASAQVVTIHTSMAITEQMAFEEMIISPNPSDGLLTWNKPQQFQLLSSIGTLLFFGEGNSVDISACPPGLYYLRISSGNTYKIIKY
jgi:FtsP/CotA-like multicopper oxidase with cupredoxin domain